MISTKYRLRLESICKDIASGTEVTLEDKWIAEIAEVELEHARELQHAMTMITL